MLRTIRMIRKEIPNRTLSLFWYFLFFLASTNCGLICTVTSFAFDTRINYQRSITTTSSTCISSSQQQQQQQQQRRTDVVEKTSTMLFGSRKEEIMKLEEQLRRLKEEGEKNNNNDQDPVVVVVVNEKKSEEDLELEAFLQRKLEIMKGKDMILSEKELIDGGIVTNAASDLGKVVPTLLGSILAIVLLIGLSQVPIGQEGLNQYSATGSASTVLKEIDLGDMNPNRTE